MRAARTALPAGTTHTGLSLEWHEDFLLRDGVQKMLRINERIAIPENEIELRGIRAQGPGGQNVNKVSSAVRLRFDIHGSSLSRQHKERLLAMTDKRVTKDGIVNIKAQQFRSRERNEEMARERLRELISRAALARKKRKTTKPNLAARQRRLWNKARRSQLKVLRGQVAEWE